MPFRSVARKFGVFPNTIKRISNQRDEIFADLDMKKNGENVPSKKEKFDIGLKLIAVLEETNGTKTILQCNCTHGTVHIT